jgi:hypothetical protein
MLLCVVVYLFRLITNRSKGLCGLTLLGRKKKFHHLLFRRCVCLLLGREDGVFLDACFVRTSLWLGWQTVSGERW